MSDVATLTFEDRLKAVLERTMKKVGPEVRSQLQALLAPEALAIMAGVLVAWIVSHAFGLGEVIDIILVVLGVGAIGLAVFSGLDHLYDFAVGTYNARTNADLDAAADHLAKAIGILGIQAVLAVLFRGARRPGTGGRMPVGRPPPPRGGGVRYRPTTKRDPSLRAGEGGTSLWGDIRVSTRGSLTDQRLVLLHERVHQFLAPKFYVLRNFRVENRAGSYFNSSLWRYVEEALAETTAQVGVSGMREFFTGISFPVRNGYVSLTRGGGYNASMRGRGVLPEIGTLIGTGTVQGIAYNLWFSPQPPRED